MIFPKKPQLLYAPMLGTIGGGSLRGYGRGTGGGAPDFIWALTGFGTGGGCLYQLDPDTLAVTGHRNIRADFGYTMLSQAGLNNVTCDDEGNIYFVAGSTSIYANYLVKFAPDFSKQWDAHLGGNGGGWTPDWGIPYYRKSDDTLYVAGDADGSTNTGNIHKVDPATGSSTVFTMYSGGGDYLTGNTNAPRNFIVAENENTMVIGGSNTSSSSKLYFSSFQAGGTQLTAIGNITDNGGAVGLDYSPTNKYFWYSSQYNSDAIKRAYYNNYSGGMPTSVTQNDKAYANAYMYGGAIAADGHPMFGSGVGGGGLIFSFYDGNNSYAFRSDSVQPWNFQQAPACPIQGGMAGGRAYNPNNERFYVVCNSSNGYGSNAYDAVSFKLAGSFGSSIGSNMGNFVSTSSGWQQQGTYQQASGRVVIHHSSSRGTQTGQ